MTHTEKGESKESAKESHKYDVENELTSKSKHGNECANKQGVNSGDNQKGGSRFECL